MNRNKKLYVEYIGKLGLTVCDVSAEQRVEIYNSLGFKWYVLKCEVKNQLNSLKAMGRRPKENNIADEARVHPNVIMGIGNVIMEGAIVREGVIMGDNNYIGPYCIIGDAPEKHGYWNKTAGVRIGNGNRFTKQVTIDAGTETPTVIHNDVIMLKNAHVGHDAVIFAGVILSCNSIIGGHTQVGAKTNFGLGAVAHQRLQIPEGCMVGMNSTITKKTYMQANRKYAGSPARDIGENKR